MTAPIFTPGQTYNRRRDIHDPYGGQEQSGIITPSRLNAVIIVTGGAGAAFGYHDRYRADGVMEYYGEGQRGDMEFVRGNRAIRDHEQNGKDLLVFEKRDRALFFLGPMRYLGHRMERGRDLDGIDREVIVFLLESV